VNGFNGTNFSSVSSVSAAKSALRGLLATGLAACLPTVVSSSPAAYAAALPILAAALADPEFHGRALGLHLEGPFIHPVGSTLGSPLGSPAGSPVGSPRKRGKAGMPRNRQS